MVLTPPKPAISGVTIRLFILRFFRAAALAGKCRKVVSCRRITPDGYERMTHAALS